MCRKMTISLTPTPNFAQFLFELQFVHSEHIASQWDLQLIFLMHNSDPVLAYEATGRAFFGSLHHLEKKRNLI
jgi:hypothetical protein